MKKLTVLLTRFILVLASLLAFTGVAQAVMFTVSNISLDPTYNNNGDDKTNFIWSVSNGTSSSNDIGVGESKTFTYGTFTTNDFKISNNDLNDYLNGTVGTFTASFYVSPPTPGVQLTQFGTPAVTGTIKNPANGNGDATNGGVWVDFDNNAIIEEFDNGGKYEVTFNDINSISANGIFDLTASIKLDSDDPPPVPVPEPGTLMLLGAGFLGLAVYGKRHMNGIMHNIRNLYI